MAPSEHVSTRHVPVGEFEEQGVQEDGVRPGGIDNVQTDRSKSDGGEDGGNEDWCMKKPDNDGEEKNVNSQLTAKGGSNLPNILPAPADTSTSVVYPTQGYPTEGGHPFTAVSPTTVISITTAPAMTMTVVVTTTASSTNSSKSSSSSSPAAAFSAVSSSLVEVLTQSTSTPASSSSSAAHTVTVYAPLPDPSNQPRKGLDGNIPTTTTVWESASFRAESALSAPTSTLVTDGVQTHYSKDQNNSEGKLSPTAENFLIAAGAIGAFIIVATAVWFFARMRKIDLLASLRTNKGERGGNQENYYTEPPPQYFGTYTNEKAMAARISQQNETFYSPTNILTVPVLARTNSQRQELNRGIPMEAPSMFTQMIATAQQGSAPQTFYSFGEPPLPRQGTQTSQVSAAHSGYMNTETQQSFQTLGMYDPNQREVNRLSFLSSLSSGFGDGLIMPESTVVGANDTRQSYHNTRKFSWTTAQERNKINTTGSRDTIYTTSSVETAPRFRTVNSWVAQQSGRVGRQERIDREAPNVPPIPISHKKGNTPLHSRNQSEDTAFRYHPGDKLSLGRGSRVPSIILDRKFNVNSR